MRSASVCFQKAFAHTSSGKTQQIWIMIPRLELEELSGVIQGGCIRITQEGRFDGHHANALHERENECLGLWWRVDSPDCALMVSRIRLPTSTLTALPGVSSTHQGQPGSPSRDVEASEAADSSEPGSTTGGGIAVGHHLGGGFGRLVRG
jgi:hypothetical protein